MFPAPDRREFLRVLVGGLGIPSVSSVASGRPHPSTQVPGHPGPVSANRLGDHLMMISGAGGNVVVADGAEGLLMVNGGLAAHSAGLLKMIGEHAGGRPVHTLFNTDWHPEHTGSNETLGQSGARIIAHAHTKQYLGEELFVEWQNRTYKPLPSRAIPDHTFYTSATMTFGGERVEYGHLGQAHTDGDIYVFFPGPNVLVAGDVLSVGKYPIADYTTGGWLGGLANATKTLLDLANADTRFVPGVGPVQTRADVQAQHEMLLAMRDRLGKMMRQGMGADDMLAAGATKDFDGRWGAPDLFVSTAYKGLWLHVRELGGIV
jgi:cyclase